MKTQQQHLAELRSRNAKRRADSAKLRSTQRKIRAAELERFAERTNNVNTDNPMIEEAREKAEELRQQADQIMDDYRDREDERYFSWLDPYAYQREHTELSWVNTDQENSGLVVMIDLDDESHIRGRDAERYNHA